MSGVDIIIVGGGVSGLMAARELARAGKKVLILEAKSKLGGRIHTIQAGGFTQYVEAGAEFVHGKLPFTLQLLKEAGIKTIVAEGDIWQIENGRLNEQDDFVMNDRELNKRLEELDHDMSIKTFLDTYFPGAEHADLRNSVTRFIQGYEAADISRASTLAMRKDLLEEEEEQYRTDGGYSKMTDHLAQQCKEAGVLFSYSTVVDRIVWGKGKLTVHAGANEYTADKVLVTVPLGVLQAEPGTKGAIEFSPAIPNKLTAARLMGAGQVVKVLIEFKEAFWRSSEVKHRLHADTGDMFFLFSNAVIPTWWTQHPNPSNLLTGWIAGPDAEKYRHATDAEILADAIGSLADVFGISSAELRSNIRVSHISNWIADPFTRCAYSYATTDTDAALEIMTEPVEDTIFFAGEAIYKGSAAGTVEAALVSAVNVVKHILDAG